MTYTVVTPKDYTNTDVDNIVTGSQVNVFSFIPTNLQQDILDGTLTEDVTSYLNAAHAAAGIGGRVDYPSGKYLCSNVTYYDRQSVHGTGGTSTVLSKVGLLGSDGNSILVPYQYLNNIPTKLTGNLIEGIGFQADAISTGGYALVISATRARINNCTITASSDGVFGGFRVATNTLDGHHFADDANSIAGVHFTNNAVNGCVLGGLSAQATIITALTPNVSITLSRPVNGFNNGSNTYTDESNGNLTFTGISNGTNVILVANTTGISVGDLITGIDIITDNATDLYLHMNIFQNCGSKDGIIGSVDSPKMQGWIIVQNKFEHPWGPLLNNPKTSHSLLIANNLFDYKPQGALGGGATNYCMNITCDGSGRNVIIGNQFKCRNVIVDSGAANYKYRIVWIGHSYAVPGNTTSSAHIFSNNTFDLPLPPTTMTDFVAFHVEDHTATSGIATGNCYDTDFTITQRGNGDIVWAMPNQVPLTVALTAFATGGQASATLLSYGFNEIHVCATNGDSVKLPPALGTGLDVEVGNMGAANAAVFPSTGDAINKAGANNSVTLNANVGAIYRDYAVGLWRSIP